jgi:hypothetical protein
MTSGPRVSGPIPVGQRRAQARSSDAPHAAERSAARPQAQRGPLLDPDAPSWVHGVSITLCVLLVVSALVALAFQRPGAVKLGKREFEAATTAAVRVPPTVEPLEALSASTSPGELRRLQERALAGSLTREADVIVSGERAGCFGLEPEGDVCLGPASRVRVGELGRGVELLSGRAVISVERLEDGVSLSVALGGLRVEAKDAVLGLSLEAEGAVVGVLRGAALVSAGDRVETLERSQSALYRASDGHLEVMALAAEKARADWELLAARGTRD